LPCLSRCRWRWLTKASSSAPRALAAAAPTGGLAAAIVIADMLAVLPITIAGLGVREKAFESLLGRWYDVPPAPAVLGSLAGFAVLAAVAAAGALLLPLRAEAAA